MHIFSLSARAGADQAWQCRDKGTFQRALGLCSQCRNLCFLGVLCAPLQKSLCLGRDLPCRAAAPALPHSPEPPETMSSTSVPLQGGEGAERDPDVDEVQLLAPHAS